RRFAHHPLIRAMLAQPEGTFTGESLDGVRRIYGFVQLPGTSARLAVGLDEGEVMRRANREIMMSLAGLLLMTAVVLAAISSRSCATATASCASSPISTGSPGFPTAARLGRFR